MNVILIGILFFISCSGIAFTTFKLLYNGWYHIDLFVFFQEIKYKKNLKNIRGKYAINGEGSVVIITGASSGLGK